MPDWDDMARSWDDNPDVRTYAAQAFASLQPLLTDSDRRILDLGAGTGLLTERLAGPGRSIVAVDLSARMLDVLAAKALPGVQTICADLTAADTLALPALSPGFDLIVASSVCAFVPDYPGLLAVLAGLLRPGGRLVQWDWLREEGGDFGFSVSDLQEALSGAGLAVDDVGISFSMQSQSGPAPVIRAVATRR